MEESGICRKNHNEMRMIEVLMRSQKKLKALSVIRGEIENGNWKYLEMSGEAKLKRKRDWDNGEYEGVGL